MPALRNVTTESRLQASNRQVFNHRQRLLPADLQTTPGIFHLNPPEFSTYGYRLVDLRAVANGGAAAGITSLVLGGYQGGTLVALATIPVAGLTQSTLLRMGDATITILANGASLMLCDKGQGLRIYRVGSALTGATSIDIFSSYIIEKT